MGFLEDELARRAHKRARAAPIAPPTRQPADEEMNGKFAVVLLEFVRQMRLSTAITFELVDYLPTRRRLVGGFRFADPVAAPGLYHEQLRVHGVRRVVDSARGWLLPEPKRELLGAVDGSLGAYLGLGVSTQAEPWLISWGAWPKDAVEVGVKQEASSPSYKLGPIRVVNALAYLVAALRADNPNRVLGAIVTTAANLVEESKSPPPGPLRLSRLA
jgi:hypothetical protein